MFLFVISISALLLLALLQLLLQTELLLLLLYIEQCPLAKQRDAYVFVTKLVELHSWCYCSVKQV